ncbi:MAG: hypothetical protein JWQ74_276 [Marmoricola sp.]|nr:hypothetical protein [Marmoricola sp.]
MAKRVSLPTADDLFRPTAAEEDDAAEPAVAVVPDTLEVPAGPGATATSSAVKAVPRSAAKPKGSPRQPSGRVRHDEKMTVYVTADELVEIEHARLDLRRHHGLAVDRGRLVREALAIVLADLDQHGDNSDLVRRLLSAE